MTGGGLVGYCAEPGVAADATAPDLRRAYRRLGRRHHPDLTRDSGAAERFVAAAQACEVLRDPAPGRRGVLELTAVEAGLT